MEVASSGVRQPVWRSERPLGVLLAAACLPFFLAVASPTLAQDCPCTAFGPTDTPAVAAFQDAPIEVGVKFRSTVDGYITGVRFYKGAENLPTHIGHLWSSTGTLLAEATFTGETASGWQEVPFDSPVQISANTTYVASYHTSAYYAYTSAYFASSPVVRGPLRLLAEGEDGSNGVYGYGGSQFPTSSFNSTNYWVDIVFNTVIVPDQTPPTVMTTSPLSNAVGVIVSSNVRASFSEALDPASVTNSTFQLRDPSLATVPATVTYDVSSRTATLAPSAPLAYSTTYTAVLKGGAATPHITDRAGNALAADYTWSFTTPSSPDQGPGGPILVISSTSNPFSRYPVELLRAEGLNLFAAQDIGSVTAGTLTGYDVVVLGDMTLSAAQVTMLSDWVNSGGTLIALHPDKQLASLLGLTDASGTLSNKYLGVNTTSGAGVGIVGETMQYHGSADLYTLNGATAVATLYSDAHTATAYPAVTTRTVGANGGQAVAFTYDLARSIVYTRQGNPAWAGQERDGLAPRRSDDMFYGNASGDPQPDWVDLAKVAIPQADEQQRLLANLILTGNLHRKPLPRFWYFPKGKKAVLVMTGDNHANGVSMTPRMDTFRQMSPAGCSVDDWECVRASGYDYVNPLLSNSQAAFYDSLGFEIALHVLTNCADWTPSSLEAAISSQLANFQSTYPSLPAPTTNRTHCIAYSDWSSEPDIEALHGIRLDANYYYWPQTWVNDRPGVFTGSGIPMRFARLDGSIIDCYQVTTQMTDEAGQTYPKNPDSLFARALDVRGYYGAFCANMHYDQPQNESNTQALVNSALARDVPVVSARQMLVWLDGRNGSSFGGVSWSANTLSFSIAVAAGARNLRAMLPLSSAQGSLGGLTRDGSPVTFSTETIKGIAYAFFPATPGNYVATYADLTPPAISAVSATPHANGTASVTWATNEASTSRVDYGTAPGSLTSNASNPALVTSHALTLTGLVPGTTYYYRVTSADAANNSATSPNPPAAPLSFATPANAAPVAAATGVPQSGTAPLLVNFSGANSTDADGDSLTFAWAFGDGGTATGRLTSHSYAAAGSYAAILTVNDGRGGTDTASVAISVAAANRSPVAAATGVPQSGTAPLLVNFSGANSTDADGDSLTFAWAFGDGGTATGRLTSHSYAAAGSYAAILTVNDGRGGTDTASVAISVTAGSNFPVTPVLDNFNRANGAIGANWVDQTARFRIASNQLAPGAGDGFIEWNRTVFGPNQEVYLTLSTITGSAPEHNLMLKTQGPTWLTGHIEVSYDAPNSKVYVYTWTPPLTWSNWGTINGVAFAPGDRFGARAFANGSVEVYRNSTLLGVVSVAGWPFAALGGRIGLSAVEATTARFDDFGGGNVSLSANAPPVAAAVGIPRSGLAPLLVAFSGATSTDADGDSLTFSWTFGDGGTATGRLTSHTYGSAGNYAAILTVNDGRGGSDTASVAISASAPPVNTPPVAAATGVPTSGTVPLLVNFSGANSTDANGDSLTFSWTFGDGGTATGRLTSHNYPAVGNYAVILTVNDGHGGTDTASVAISVSPLPSGFPQTAVLDNFNRANGAIGPNWIDQPARFSIAANTLAPATLDNYIEWNGVFGANQEVFVTLSTVNAASEEHNLMLKTQGTSWAGGHIEVSYLRTASRVTVYTFAPPNTWVTWGAFNGVTFASGNQFGARALSDGTVQVYKNGALIGTVSVAGWAFAAQGGRIGLSVWNASASRFDDFGGGTVTGSLALADPPAPQALRAAPPEALSLSSAYPNPTTGRVTMSLSLPREDDVSLSVVDVQGREVWRAPSQHFAAGRSSLSWDGRGKHGPAGAGLYLARIHVGAKVFLRRVAVVR